MQIEQKGGDAFAYLDLQLEPGEQLIAESDAMSSMDSNMDVTAKLNGGLIKGLLRKYLGGETLFINKYSNNSQQKLRLVLAQPTPGAIRCIDMDAGESLFLQPGAFLACTSDVRIELKWAGFVSFLAREGLFRIMVSGPGTVWYGAYGTLLDRKVDGECLIDTSHLVAYPPSVKLKLQLAGGIFSSFFGGEGFVTRLEGEGNVVIQTRSLSGLTGWLNPKLRG
jgi:uncharacterized protein (TIGR00266 family)